MSGQRRPGYRYGSLPFCCYLHSAFHPFSSELAVVLIDSLILNFFLGREFVSISFSILF